MVVRRARHRRARARARAGRARARARRPRGAAERDAARSGRSPTPPCWRPAASSCPSTRRTRPRSAATSSTTPGARAVIVENAAQLEKIEAVRDQLPGLEHIVSMEDTGDGPHARRAARARGEDPTEALETRLARSTPDDVATIVYTSGTTGPPKGCMLTHAQPAVHGRRVRRAAARLRDPPPLCSCSCRSRTRSRGSSQIVSLDVGGTLAFWSGDRASGSSRTIGGGASRPTSRPSRACSRRSTPARSPAAARAAASRRAIFSWARRDRPAGRARPSAPARRRRCCERVRHALGRPARALEGPRAVRRPARARRSPAPRRSPPRCSSSSTPAASRCSRATG